MVWQFLSLRLVFLASPTAARVLVFLGQAVQLGLLVWFLAACSRTRTAPEPFWNTPTVSAAVSAVAGIGVGLPAGFSVGCFVLALSLQLALVPRQVCLSPRPQGAQPWPKTHLAQDTPCRSHLAGVIAGVAHLVRRHSSGLALRGHDAGSVHAECMLYRVHAHVACIT